MKKTNQYHKSDSLDPEDWDLSRQLMHKMVDDAYDYLENVKDRPIWQDMPPKVLDFYKSKHPKDSTKIEKVYSEFKENVLPYPMGNIHPRFWAWYMGAGTISGVMGDFWASVINCNMGGGNHAGHQIEEQVINWMKEIIGFPESSSGLLVSGGSMANFTALAVGRNVKAGYDIRNDGITSEIASKMRIYASTEIHSSNQKAIELLGLGSIGLVKVETNDDYTINLDLLSARIKSDKQLGLIPLCVIGTSGTVNTGAIDDLETLSKICREEDLWFHIDGAIGAIAVLSDVVKPKLKGLELADSVALDLHKWLHMPFEAGCVIIKNRQAHKDTFALTPEYLAKNARGIASGDDWFSEYGLQLSRRFRALKIWMSLKEHGTERFGEMITKNVNQAKYLESLINASELLELTAKVGLDIVCFRFNPGNLSDHELNEINIKIKLQLEDMAIALPGYTTLNKIYCLRIAICNHRTEEKDFNLLIDKVIEIGSELQE